MTEATNGNAALLNEIDRIAVIGGGTIGASWAALFLAQGYAVDLFDPREDCQDHVGAFIDQAWPSLEQLGLADKGRREAIAFHNDPAAAAQGARFVKEAVPERIEIKHETYRLIEPVLAPGAVIATSTSGLLLSDLQKGFNDPSGLVLAHPFNPPHLIPLVELLGNDQTNPEAVDLCEAFFQSCGKVTIRVNKEVPGHVANRLQAALWREAIDLVMEDVASVEDVDKAIAHGPGLRWAIMGPHMLFSLASGGHGIRGFCEHFGPPINVWLESLGSPMVNDAVAEKLATGLVEEEAGRDFKQLTKERDKKLIAMLRAFRETSDS